MPRRQAYDLRLVLSGLMVYILIVVLWEALKIKQREVLDEYGVNLYRGDPNDMYAKSDAFPVMYGQVSFALSSVCPRVERRRAIWGSG